MSDDLERAWRLADLKERAADCAKMLRAKGERYRQRHDAECQDYYEAADLIDELTAHLPAGETT